MGTRSTTAKKATTEPTTAINELEAIESEQAASTNTKTFKINLKDSLSIVNGNNILYFGHEVVKVTIEMKK